MSYDRMDWHCLEEFPKDLPPENGGTHIGMFLAWCIMNALESDDHKDESADEVEAVRAREMTGREFLQNVCDGKFWEEDLSPEGGRFTEAYYLGSDGGFGVYLDDYNEIFTPAYPTMFHVEDTWENYDKIAQRIQQRFEAFQKSGSVVL